MFKKLFGAFGIARASGGTPRATGLHDPYREAHTNYFYNLLFCDDPALFMQDEGEQPDDPRKRLLAEPPDVAALREFARDGTQEGRLRLLAYRRLAALGEMPSSKELLGVVVEVPLEGGLDVLAAFNDGGVRYLNQSGKIFVGEDPGHPVGRLAQELIAVARPVIDQIGPWDAQRLAPPKMGNIRITFLVSDGLYFGEGPYAVFQSDAMAGPILAKATELLQQVVDTGTR